MSTAGQRLLAKSADNVRAVQRLISDGHHEIAISRAYYVMFYAAQAALLTKGKTYARHSATIQGFWEHFVKTGLVRRQLHEVFADAFEGRSECDYDDMVTKHREDAERVLRDAEAFLRAVTPLIT